MSPNHRNTLIEDLPQVNPGPDSLQVAPDNKHVTALVISVEDFHAHECAKTGPPQNCACRHDEAKLNSLRGFHQHAEKVCDTYQKHDIDCTSHVKDTVLTTAEIHQEIMNFVSGNGPPWRIVHVVTHGLQGHDKEVYISGADGFFPAPKKPEFYLPPRDASNCHIGTVIKRIIEEVERDSSAPQVLLVLDICSGGLSLDLVEHLVPREELSPAWIITAVSPTNTTYDALLTQAICACLSDKKWMKAVLGSATQHLTWPVLGESLKSQFDQKAREHFTNLDVAPRAILTRTDCNPTVEFFKNLAFQDTSSRVYGTASASLDSSLQRFPDEVQALIDTNHFVGRAQGQAIDGADRMPVIGREDEMIAIKEWLSNPPDASSPDEDHRLIVTGGRGTGKSTLLALAVCSAHPFLRAKTESLWGKNGARYLGKKLPWLIAVHARQLDVSHVQATIIKQLRHLLKENQHEGASNNITSRADLCGLLAALTDSGCDVVIVVDALDESLDCGQITQLLLELQNGTEGREAGAPPHCRVLVGVRNQDDNEAVARALTMFPAQTLDLNAVDVVKLKNQIGNFFAAYDEHLVTSSAQDLSADVAEEAAKLALAASSERHARDEVGFGSELSWGAFLIANVLLRYLVARPIENGESLKELAELSVSPTSLLALELDTLSPQAEATMRIAFTVLAFAKGEGLPLTDWQTAVAHIAGQHAIPFSNPEWLALLEDFKFYFRMVAVQGMLRYRFFHEGFAEYWRSQPLPHKKGPHSE